MPRVTVIIPTFNWSSVLPYSIASVLGQTFTDFELLVVGDHCTDDSGAVVESFGDPRVRWTNLPERSGHQSGPNNEGIRAARGELIAYLGHDDLWLPRHLELLVAAIDGGADVAHSMIALVAPPAAGRTFGTVTIAKPEWRPPSSVLHRRSLVERVGGWGDYRKLRGTPEGDLWERMRRSGARFEFVKRLTAIKFPGGWRPDVYKTRPAYEQAAWLERIRTTPDLEAIEPGKIVSLQRPSVFGRAVRLLSHPSLWLAFVIRRRGARVRAWQRLKGL